MTRPAAQPRAVNTIEMSWVVGSAQSCAVRVADEYVSAVHCRVDRLSDGTYIVTDLGSTNGTWINLTQVTSPTRIRPGDTLRVGHSDIPWARST